MVLCYRFIICGLLGFCLSVSALDTDHDKFFNHATEIPAGLSADKVYPQGTLFPFSFYSTGGGSTLKRGDLLPVAEREADQKQIIDGGVTMLGPQYELNAESLETARKYGVQLIYTVIPVVDGEPLEREWFLKLAKEKQVLDAEKVRAAVIAEVQKVVDRKEIAWWDIRPEELRFWVANEMKYLQIAYQAVKDTDPLKRPVFMYEPGHRTAGALLKLLPWQDLSAKGMYLNYSSKKTQRVWARYSIEQEVQAIAQSGRPEIVPLALPEMFQQPAPEELKRIRSWVRHDVYCTLANGAKGVVVFSASKRPKFEAREDYLKAYLEVCRELTGPQQLGQVFLFGKAMQDLECSVIDGPAEVSLQLAKETVQYPSVSIRNLSWRNQRYVFLVNSSNEAVQTVVSGLVYGSGVTVRNLFAAQPVDFTAPEGDFEVSLDPLEVAAFSIRWEP